MTSSMQPNETLDTALALHYIPLSLSHSLYPIEQILLEIHHIALEVSPVLRVVAQLQKRSPQLLIKLY
jgi:hypothetical protein